ncbi:MAG: quinoprotein dehydrogenase-associated SoxYZ-like carrier [Methylococcales bacterium]|nr:quinoprotein dehydrogenase-associated SoxYZ-like carrier [Methylococcales bacterium]
MRLLRNYLIPLLCSLALTQTVMAAPDDSLWNKTLKTSYFAGKNIQESDTVIELETPYRAEDPALVPIKIISKIKQTNDHYIKKITVIIDKNPYPFVAEFELTPKTGKADLAMRVRVNTYSYIRAIAEMNNGQLHMSKKFVKASGGCSAPIGADLETAMKRLGKMKFKVNKKIKLGEPSLAQLLISHPNITGMQMDQVTRFTKKSHFMEKLSISFNDQRLLTAKTDIAISADPNFRFYFIPEKSGVLKAEFSDTSCESPTSRKVCTQGRKYTQTYTVAP